MEKFIFITLPVKYVKYSNNASDELSNKVLADIGKNYENEIEDEFVINTTFNVFDLIRNLEIRPFIDDEFNTEIRNRTHVSCSFGELEVSLSVEQVKMKIINALSEYELNSNRYEAER